MYLFTRTRTLNEQLATSGRSAITVGATHAKPISDTVVIRVFHPTTGGGRSMPLSRSDVAELHAALGTWLAEGWAAFVPGSIGPGGGYDASLGESGSGADAWQKLKDAEAARKEALRLAEEKFAGTYTSWTHGQLVREIEVRLFNEEQAKRETTAWRTVADGARADLRGVMRRLRSALAGKSSATVAELQAALDAPEDETPAQSEAVPA